ncbi:hypothetical protein ECANGB1_1840 [Enterospora canceri]|uniref:Uncharacterized protein n=1 Tax=Enterospora canceri TaxID=1081671 RepID=A0A1Y1S644_9MICR|nr:hypothetical protein ECANGB1_1840 [Enterospora canceri]
MKGKLSDKTNATTDAGDEQKGGQNKTGEQCTLINYLKQKKDETADYNLKYDISKCIEILEGKENQEVTEIKDALYNVILEKEELFKTNCELVCEINDLKNFKDCNGK